VPQGHAGLGPSDVLAGHQRAGVAAVEIQHDERVIAAIRHVGHLTRRIDPQVGQLRVPPQFTPVIEVEHPQHAVVRQADFDQLGPTGKQPAGPDLAAVEDP